MDIEDDCTENGNNHIHKSIAVIEKTEDNFNTQTLCKSRFIEVSDDNRDNGTEPLINDIKDTPEGNEEIKEEVLDLSVHVTCKSSEEGEHHANGSVKESEKFDDEDTSDGCLESKDEILDLTFHCEPRLSEDEDSDGEDERAQKAGHYWLSAKWILQLSQRDENDSGNTRYSLTLEEVCVDPLEFLEVDQDRGSSDGEDDKPAAENEAMAGDQSEQAGRNQRLPPGFIVCEKCGYPKNTIKQPKGSKPKNNKFDKNEKQVLCVCDSEKFQCKLCSKYIRVIAYDFHMLRHRRAGEQHRCEECNKTFLDAVNLRNHVLIIHKGHTHSCDTCGKTFRYVKSLNSHLASCNKRRYYKCNKCGESFTTKRPLLVHLKTHEKSKSPGEATNICEICCIVFDNSSSKKEHIMQVHVAAQRFVCSACGEAFSTESSMKRHRLSHDRCYPCKICDAKFSLKRDLKIHMIQHRTLKDLCCKTCGEQFDSTIAFMKHKLQTQTQSCKDNVKICDICNKSFKDTTALKKHVVVHTPLSERSVKCDVCQRSFSGNSALKKHIRLIHADARPYTCEFCSKSFNQLCKLKYHIVCHASDKPVTCDICNKGFSSDKDIKIHMLTHTGEKPFKCNICNKSFRQRGHVKTHQLVHTREKPYHCEICNKSFGLPSSLKKHLRLHSSNNSIAIVKE